MLVYEYFKVRKLLIFYLNVGLWSANSSLCVPYGKCSVSVHGTLWKVFCLCAQYTFLMYRLQSVLSLCRVHIYDVPSEKCCVSVHSTHFWYIVWKVFWDCAQYTFPIYRLVSVLFVYALRISEVMSGKCFLSVHSMTMLIVFFDIRGVVYHEYVPAGQTARFYVEFLKRLRERVRRARPELWAENAWILH